MQYRKALSLADGMGSTLLRARIMGNIARTLLKNRQVGEAERLVDRAMRLASNGEAAAWRPQIVAIAAQAALQRGDTARASALIGERFRGVDTTTTTLADRDAHQTAYDTYLARGDAALAVRHLAALKRLDDQATKLATSANSALAASRFDFANQELRLQTLQNEDLQRAARTQRTIFLGAAGAAAAIMLLLLAGLVTIRRSRDRERAAKDDLTISNAALGKALAARTEFLATTSHEIRTPLNGILGMTQVMLADRRLLPDLRDRIGVVHSAGTTMRALVDDILDVAKMENGALTVEPAPFDLTASLADAARMWEDQARSKGLSFTLDLAASPRGVLGDAARVRQIVFNLLSNAVKFTAAGSVTLTAAWEDGAVIIRVADTGIGIAADKQVEIFEPFRQADAGTTRRFGGTGLGLAICRNLAHAMGGEVAVDSVEGKGAVFTLRLPLAPVAGVIEQDGAEIDERPAVLIVDRNPITRAMLKTLLAPHACAVSLAGSPDEADLTGIGRVLLDDGALGEPDGRVDAAAACAARIAVPVTLLWTGEPPAALRALGLHVITKPIGGPALVERFFGDAGAGVSGEPLVPIAA